MKYHEASHAKDLHRTLTGLAERVPGITATVSGSGVHWNCTAISGANVCSIALFHSGAAEYLISFERDAQEIAAGRTASKSQTISAVADWLQGRELSWLYVRFPFVDKDKRSLTGLQHEVVTLYEELASATSELQQLTGDIYELWFRADGRSGDRSGDRSCHIFFYGKNKFPDAVFHWDECELFGFKADSVATLAAVLKRWLCDGAMPSTMRLEFPWLKLGQLADYYEAGEPITGEFMQSWDSIQRFYADWERPFVPQVRALIAQMRRRGYDKSLRAGQSLWTLILSRSRRHGLRQNQPSLAFDFHDDGMAVWLNNEPHHILKYRIIEFTPELDALLKQLETQPVD